MESVLTLNTSANSVFFSRVINLIGSVKKHNCNSIEIRVWDLGLNSIERFFLRLIDVEVANIPAFCTFWAECYTWKAYVLKHSPGNLFLHLDAGNTVLCNLDEIFNLILKDGYFFVDQGQVLEDISPPDYIEHFAIGEYSKSAVIAAGNIGFNRNVMGISDAISLTFDKAIDGLCLGFSAIEENRADGKIYPPRKCLRFRHDQTVLNCSLRAIFGTYKILDHSIYAALKKDSNTKILNQRKRSYWYIFHAGIYISPIIITYCIAVDCRHLFRNFIRRSLINIRNIIYSNK